MKKKLVSVLLSAAMASSLLAGCGSSDAAQTAQDTAEAVQETEKYNKISIVGANGEKDLTQCKVAPHNWYLLDYEVTAETKVKFRANPADTKVWGGDGSQPITPVVYTLPTGDKEITVPAGTYDIFLNDITGNWTILKTK